MFTKPCIVHSFGLICLYLPLFPLSNFPPNLSDQRQRLAIVQEVFTVPGASPKPFEFVSFVLICAHPCAFRRRPDAARHLPPSNRPGWLTVMKSADVIRVQAIDTRFPIFPDLYRSLPWSQFWLTGKVRPELALRLMAQECSGL